MGTVEEALQALKDGKIILTIDDPDRENEGDLICAAQFATTENVNMMASKAKGLICMPMSHKYIEKLGLSQMVAHNTDNHCTAFTESIDHITTTTGISAEERGITARACVDENARPADFRRPGHMFPLEARKGGVLERNGHTEATVDLCRLAGLKEVGLCCEIMADNGKMMRTSELKQFAEENGYSKLEDLDLAALLRVADKSWYDMRSFAYLPTRDRQCVRDMMKVRNNWAHLAGAISDKDIVLRDLDILLAFFENVMVTNKYTDGISEFRKNVESADFSAVFDVEPVTVKVPEAVPSSAGEIQEKDRVFLTGSPDTKGMVFSISNVGGTKKYEVFVDGEIKTFYDGQIQKIDAAPSYSWVDISTLQSNLTAYEINNPSAGNLY